MSAVGGVNSTADGGTVPTELARHYRLLAERLLAEGRAAEAADALRAGLVALETRFLPPIGGAR